MDFIARKIDGEMYVSIDQVNRAIEEKNAEIENIKATHYAEIVECYLKSEADKVIEELKKACNDKDDWCMHTLKEIRHQKYRRCLDKAALCERMRIDAADYRIPREKWDFYDKWHRRWLELAEKLKEAK